MMIQRFIKKKYVNRNFTFIGIIGVEIEMNNITRKAAAKLAAEFFGTSRTEYTAHRNGYETYSAWDEQGRELCENFSISA